MAKRKGSSSASRPRTRSKARRDAREVENAQRLDKLPPEVWEKILDNLHKNDLFPLALSCRYFRQKEKELVARTRQSGPRRGKGSYSRKLTLWSQKSYYIMQPASPDYLRFCRDCGTPWLDWTRLMYLAAYHGHLTLLQELVISSETHLPNDFASLARYAARGGQLETLQWLKTEKGVELRGFLFVCACIGNSLEVLRWLRSEGCDWDDHWETCAYTACEGHLETLKWLRSEGCPWDTDRALMCRAAVAGGRLSVLKYVHENGCQWDEEVCSGAAEGGHYDMLKYAHENGCPWKADTCTAAVERGDLDMLKYLHENGCPWNGNVCNEAAANDRLDVLKYAHENGCPWDEETCSIAAVYGHLDVLKYLHENGCPWNEETCESAARGGHLDVLKYARENGCPDYSDDYSDADDYWSTFFPDNASDDSLSSLACN